MKITRTFAIAMAIALVACVSHAGLFDAIKSVANEAANVADGVTKVSDAATKTPEAVSSQTQTSPDEQARAEFARRRKQEAEAREARIKSQTKQQNGGSRVVRNGVVAVRQDNQTCAEQPLKEIDRFLNEELAKEIDIVYPHRNRDRILSSLIAYLKSRDASLGAVRMCGGTQKADAGFRDAKGAIVGGGLCLDDFYRGNDREAENVRKIVQNWLSEVRARLAISKAAAPMNEFLNGDFKKKLQDFDREILKIDSEYAARFLNKNDSEFARLALEFNKKFDPQFSLFNPNNVLFDVDPDIAFWTKEKDRDKGYATWNGNGSTADGWSIIPEGLWLNPSITDPQIITDGIVAWKKKFEEDVDAQIAAARAGAEERRQAKIRAEKARKEKQAKTAAALASWEKRLKEFGYSSEQIAELLVKIKQMMEDGFASNDNMIMGLLNIRDQREVAKDAAAAKKINLNDPKTLSENDKIIIAHIDQELVPRLMLQGAVSKQEIDQLKIQLLVQIHKVQEDLQVQAADLQIKEIIRMHNL